MRLWITRLAALWALLGGLCLFLVVAATMANVAGFTLDLILEPLGWSFPGLPGYEEAVALLVGAGALMLFPYCQLRRGHIAVELFVQRTPLPVRRTLDRLWLAGMAAAALFLGVMMVRGGLESRADGVVTGVLGWPEWIFYIPGSLSVLLWAAVTLAMLVDPDPQDTDPGGPHG